MGGGIHSDSARYSMSMYGSQESAGNRAEPFDWNSAIESTDWKALRDECSSCVNDFYSDDTWRVPFRKGAWRTVPLNLILSAGDLQHLSSTYRAFQAHDFWCYRLKFAWPFLYMVHDLVGQCQWIVRFIGKEANFLAAEFLESVEPRAVPGSSESVVWVAQILGDLILETRFAFVDEDHPDGEWRWRSPGK